MVDTPRRQRRLSKRDWAHVAEYIVTEMRRRKRERTDTEKAWEQIDKQVAMDKPTWPAGTPEWFPSVPLPLQAETLEILESDARRMLFPTDRSFFDAKASMLPEDLRRLDFDGHLERTAGTPIHGTIEQRGPEALANAIVRGFLEHIHTKYDLRKQWDLMNSDAFKYGDFTGRVKVVSRETVFDDFRGRISQRDRFPALTATSIKSTYLDDSPQRALHEGQASQPTTIRVWSQNVHDVRLAASKGSNDPTRDDGGWMPRNLTGIEGKKDNHVDLVEMEGDFLIPRSSGPAMYLPNSIVTVVMGAGKEAPVIRYRESRFPFRSYLHGTYQRDDVADTYGSSPLMKGGPISTAATWALNQMLAAGMQSVGKPIAYSPDDPYLAAEGGPQMAPWSVWKASTKPTPIDAGDVGALTQSYIFLLQQYADVTGITAPRLGQQTKSHQTAFAIDQEQTRGVVRTVDYVRSLMMGPMLTFLHMELEMCRSLPKQTIWLSDYNGFLEVSGSQLPRHVNFDVNGAGQPLEEREREQRFLQATQSLVALALQSRQAGEPPRLDIEAVMRRVAEFGGINSDELIPRAGSLSATPPGAAGISGALGFSPSTDIASVAPIR